MSIIIAASVIAFFYVGISYLVPRLVHYSELSEMVPSLVRIAEIYMPTWFSKFVLIGGLFAILTSIYSSLIIGSRAVYALSRDGYFPKVFCKTNKANSPYIALTLTFILPAIFIYLGFGMIEFATMGSVIVLLFAAIVSLAPVVVMKKHPELYKNAKFKLSPTWVYVVAIVSCASCIILCLGTLKDQLGVWTFIVAWYVPGLILYNFRKNKVNVENMSK